MITLELRPYQQEDVEFLLKRDTAGCFNEQRTGKTPTSLSVIKARGLSKNLIVCPASAIYVWKEEYEKWVGEPCVAVTGTPKQKEQAIASWESGLVISYDSFKTTKNSDGAIDLIQKHKPNTIIIDEAHRIKTRTSATHKAIKRIFRKIKYRLALTGTPAPGKPEEIWAILHFIDPVAFSSYWGFIEEYFEKNLSFAGVKHYEIGAFLPGKERELQLILSQIATQRKRKDVMPWLPKREPNIKVHLPLTKHQERYLLELKNYFETETVVTKGILDRLVRYRQICLHPELVGLKGTSPKLDWVLQYLKDYPEESIIIFSKFTSFLRILHEHIPDAQIICGDTTPQQRFDVVRDFQDGKFKILLLNIDAGKEALTLDRANTIIFTDKYPPIGDIEQAQDRFIPTSQDRVKGTQKIYELIMKHSYDEVIYDLLEQRKEQTDIINDFKRYLTR